MLLKNKSTFVFNCPLIRGQFLFWGAFGVLFGAFFVFLGLRFGITAQKSTNFAKISTFLKLMLDM